MSDIARDIKIRKYKVLNYDENLLAQQLNPKRDELFLIITTVEKVEGDPVSFMLKRAGLEGR